MDRLAGRSTRYIHVCVALTIAQTVVEASGQRYLGSWAYTIPPTAPAYEQMWTADDWISVDPVTGKEFAWQNIIFVTGNDTAFCELSKEVLRRTGTNLPMLFYFGGWRTDLPGAPSAAASFKNFTRRYTYLRAEYPHLPETPFGVYVGDEPDLARRPERQQQLHEGLALVKATYPSAITYLNMLYGSIGCPGTNPGGPFLCNSSTWTGDPERLAKALGKMQLDWMSTDEYYDVSPVHYREVYQTRLYPHLRSEQRIILLPFAAYCEIGCQVNHTMAPAPADQRCLGSAEVHLQWAQSDSRVIGLFVYRLKNLWQRTSMAELSACTNPWQTGLGLMDRCGKGGSGAWAMPQTVEFYRTNASMQLHGGVATHRRGRIQP